MQAKVLLALAAGALTLSACGGSSHPAANSAKQTTTTSADNNTPSTLGSTAPTPATTAPAQLHASGAPPTTSASGAPACDASEKMVGGRLAVTAVVAGPALVEVTVTGAAPQTENAIVNQGSTGVVVYMNISQPTAAKVTVVKNRQFASCTVPAS